MDCIVHGILQARKLEWVAFSFSRGSSQPRDRTQVSDVVGGFSNSWATREAWEAHEAAEPALKSSSPTLLWAHSSSKGSEHFWTPAAQWGAYALWFGIQGSGIWVQPTFLMSSPITELHTHPKSPLHNPHRTLICQAFLRLMSSCSSLSGEIPAAFPDLAPLLYMNSFLMNNLDERPLRTNPSLSLL